MDSNVFIATVVPLRPRLLAQAQRLIGCVEQAEDIAQEVLLHLFLMRHRLAEYESVEALAIVMARNRALDFLRSVRPTVDLTELDARPTHSSDTPLVQVQTMQLICSAIEALPSLQKMTFRLKEVEGLEVEEIAKITGSTAEAVYNNLSRARASLRKRLTALNEFAHYGSKK